MKLFNCHILYRHPDEDPGEGKDPAEDKDPDEDPGEDEVLMRVSMRHLTFYSKYLGGGFLNELKVIMKPL